MTYGKLACYHLRRSTIKPPVSPIAFLRRLATDQQLRNPDFRRFWFSSILSNFGAQITCWPCPSAPPCCCTRRRPRWAPWPRSAPCPSCCSDCRSACCSTASRRLPVMLCSDAMVAISLASVPLAWWQGWLSIHWLYAVEFVLGTGYVVGGGAEQVFLTFLVGRDGLIDAQAKFGATESASRLLGPGLAGIAGPGAGRAVRDPVQCRRLHGVDPEPAPHRGARAAAGSRRSRTRCATCSTAWPSSGASRPAAPAGLDLGLLAPAVLRLHGAYTCCSPPACSACRRG
jgi:hypothetical protein